MKAFEIQKFNLDSLVLVERPDPKPGVNQVLVKMRAFSLNYRDLLVVNGLYNPKLKLPIVPLSDGVGEVVAVGPGVTRVKPGDRVAGAFMQQWVCGELNQAKGRSDLGGSRDGVLAELVVFDQEDGIFGQFGIFSISLREAVPAGISGGTLAHDEIHSLFPLVSRISLLTTSTSRAWATASHG